VGGAGEGLGRGGHAGSGDLGDPMEEGGGWEGFAGEVGLVEPLVRQERLIRQSHQFARI
jgi:hypothetical protein